MDADAPAALVPIEEPAAKPDPPVAAPPPELVMREVVLADTRARIPLGFQLLTYLSLLLCVLLSLGLLVSLRLSRQLRRELASTRAAIDQLQTQLEAQDTTLRQLQQVLGGVQGELRSFDDAATLLDDETPSEDPPAGAGGETPRGRPLPGGGGGLPGGWWSGGF